MDNFLDFMYNNPQLVNYIRDIVRNTYKYVNNNTTLQNNMFIYSRSVYQFLIIPKMLLYISVFFVFLYRLWWHNWVTQSKFPYYIINILNMLSNLHKFLSFSRYIHPVLYTSSQASLHII